MADAAELKIARTTSKGQFTRAEKMLVDSLNKEAVTPAPIATIKRRFEDVSQKWTKAQDAHDAYISSITATSSEDELKTEEVWITDILERFERLEILVDQHVEKAETPAVAAVVGAQVPQTTAPVQGNVIAPANSLLKLERIKLTPFDGNIRKYPDFKSTFTKHVEPQYSSDQRALVLMNNLTEIVREEVANAGDDYKKLWERLDQKYGNVNKLVDAILYQIKSLPNVIVDPASTLAMINVVEKAHRDLQQLKRETEMHNATTISMIEERMPSNIHQEWVKLVASQQINSSQKFKLLLELLQDWKNRLEYSSDSIRVTVDNQNQGSVFFANYSNQNPGVNNSLRGPSIDNFPRGDNLNVPSRRPLCWLHVSLGGAAEHPIWRCRDFKRRAVGERIQLVQVFKACVSCLLQNCPGINKPSECASKFVCRIRGCGKNHNELLHVDENATGPVPPPLQQQQQQQPQQQQLQQQQPQQRQPQQQAINPTVPVQASGTDFSSTLLPIQKL